MELIDQIIKDFEERLREGLIGEALKVFGEELAAKIKLHGGDVTYFKISKSMKL